jgi:tRNA (guanine-N7-)-methyltransferase
VRKSHRLPREELAPYIWEATDAPLDWSAVFGNDHPVEIEVGSGKGAFLVAVAPVHPDVNFLGIEIVRKYQLYCATRMAIRNLHNVRMACCDARPLLRDRVPPASVQAIHVYFPDPWWKKRHHKRRVFTPEFVASCAQALEPGGRLHLATDVAQTFELMTELCAGEPRFHRLDDPQAAIGTVEYITNFERKATTPIQRAVYERGENPSPVPSPKRGGAIIAASETSR